ncbi:MAG: hypothetical protein ABL927_11345, partial [Bdellovibrionales bacterium]
FSVDLSLDPDKLEGVLTANINDNTNQSWLRKIGFNSNGGGHVIVVLWNNKLSLIQIHEMPKVGASKLLNEFTFENNVISDLDISKEAVLLSRIAKRLLYKEIVSKTPSLQSALLEVEKCQDLGLEDFR